MIKLKLKIMIISRALGILVLLFPSALAQTGEGKENLFLKWEAVEGAVVYQVEIQDSQGKEVLNIKSEKNELEFNLPPGEYRVRIGSVNKFEKVDTWSDWRDLLVKKAVIPVIDKVSKYDFIAGAVEKGVRISGHNIEEDAEISIKNEKTEYRIRDIIYINSSVVDIDLDLSGVQAGIYDLVIENPGGMQGKSPEKLRVADKPVLPSIPTGGRISVLAGYCYTQVLPVWDKVYENSMLGFNMLVIADSAIIRPLETIPVLNITGIDLEMNYSFLKGKKRAGIIRTDMSVIMSGGNIYFRIPVIGKSSVRVKAGGGIAVSDIKEDALYSDSEDFRSMDPYCTAGINYCFPLSRYFFVEAGASYYRVFFEDKGLDSIKYSGGIGISF